MADLLQPLYNSLNRCTECAGEPFWCELCQDDIAELWIALVDLAHELDSDIVFELAMQWYDSFGFGGLEWYAGLPKERAAWVRERLHEGRNHEDKGN